MEEGASTESAFLVCVLAVLAANGSMLGQSGTGAAQARPHELGHGKIAPAQRLM